MDYIISSTLLKKGGNAIIYDRKALSGVKKIASKVAGDLKAVFGTEPKLLEEGEAQNPIYVGTVGDKLRVRVEKVDFDRRQVDFVPVVERSAGKIQAKSKRSQASRRRKGR